MDNQQATKHSAAGPFKPKLVTRAQHVQESIVITGVDMLLVRTKMLSRLVVISDNCGFAHESRYCGNDPWSVPGLHARALHTEQA